MFKNNALLLQLREGLTAQVNTPALPEKLVVEGIVKGTTMSYGFLRAQDGQSYFISPSQMSKCIPGDIVQGEVRTLDNGKTEVILEKLVSQGTDELIGFVRLRGNNLFIVPENPNIKNMFRIPLIKRGDEREGDIVVGRIIKHPFENGTGHADVLRIIGNEKDRSTAWKLACHRHHVSMETPEFISEDCAATPQLQDTEDLIDLTDLGFVTIDGEFTRDMDDALYARSIADGVIELFVAIADPDRYLSEGGAMDTQALEKAFSAYLPGTTIPMLPKVLSEQGASLIEGELRSTVCCRVKVMQDGQLGDPTFSLAKIQSKARLSYNEVQDFLDGNMSACPQSTHETLRLLDAVLARRPSLNDAASHVYGNSDYRMNVEDYDLKSIEAIQTNRAHRLVESCMITANQCFASFMHRHNLPCVYRVNGGVKAGRLDQLVLLLKEHAVLADARVMNTPEGYKKLQKQLIAENKPELSLLVRSYLARSHYTIAYGPHTTMGIEGYATFTSPIRKYSDLINQRSLKRYLRGQIPITLNESLAEHLEEGLAATNKAAAEIRNALYCRWFETKRGAEFTGRVVGISSTGARVQLLDSGAMVFIQGKRSNRLSISSDGLSLSRDGEHMARLGELRQVRIEQVNGTTRYINGQFV